MDLLSLVLDHENKIVLCGDGSLPDSLAKGKMFSVGNGAFATVTYSRSYHCTNTGACKRWEATLEVKRTKVKRDLKVLNVSLVKGEGDGWIERVVDEPKRS